LAQRAVVDVPNDATSIEIALVASGTIDLTFDDVQLDASLAPANDVAALRAEQRDRLVALIQLLGYLRFFHPGDGAATTDWQAFETEAVARMLTVQGAADGERELASLLNRLDPDAAIYRESAAPPRTAPAGAGAMLTRWVHIGLGSTDPYWSFRTGIDEPSGVGMRLSLRKSLSEIGSCKRAVAQLLVESTEGSPTVHVELAPIVPGVRAPPTATVIDAGHTTAEVVIPADAFGIAFGVFMRGFGSIHVAKLRLSCDGRAVAEINSGSPVITSGVANHLYALTRDARCGSEICLRIER
jgi:hypothetical protein